MQGRTCGSLLRDGRVMTTFRCGAGRSSLWAWIADPTKPTSFRATGAHFNDHYSKGIKNDELHIDNDGRRGQFTQYFLRPLDTIESTLDFTIEAKVIRNDGLAATIFVPYVGKFRLFPERVEYSVDSSVKIPKTPGKFHTYRILRKPGLVTLYIDGKLVLETDKVDEGIKGPAPTSKYMLAFGNEPATASAIEHSNVFPPQIIPEVTGYSIWRRFEQFIDDPVTKDKKHITWSAASGEFPDQYQLDNIVEVGACAVSHDQGYSGWTELEDGRIFVANYTDDTAGPVRPGSGIFGVAWIRGTFLEPSDLPPFKK